MLKTIDILLGLAVVMLVVSLVVTVLTQFVVSIINSRGRHLMHGLADLLQQIQPGLDREIAKSIAGSVLTHPTIRDLGSRYGSVIHREELATLLLELSHSDNVTGTAKEKLNQLLKSNGIEEPKKVLERVRGFLLHIELVRPELAADARQSIALLEEANSQFLAKVNAWFDQTVDRVSERFTFTTRGITFAMGLLVAVVLQLDTVTLVNRLSTDPELRAAMVNQAVEIAKAENARNAAGQSQAAQSQPGQNEAKDDPIKREIRAENLRQLAAANIFTIPKTWDGWSDRWTNKDSSLSIAGVLLTALLLSFGAPFWYNALQNLLRLRSVLASKDDAQREVRQTEQKAQPGAAAPAPALASIGERGDLAQLG